MRDMNAGYTWSMWGTFSFLLHSDILHGGFPSVLFGFKIHFRVFSDTGRCKQFGLTKYVVQL